MKDNLYDEHGNIVGKIISIDIENNMITAGITDKSIIESIIGIGGKSFGVNGYYDKDNNKFIWESLSINTEKVTK